MLMDMQPSGEGRLPDHGRVACTACFGGEAVVFDASRTGSTNWRITANPCAWGNPNAEVVVLGFSKGPTQAGALARTPHDCGTAWNRNPVGGVIGVQTGPH
ncbi:hypothetical protein [Roseomonas mucosa]|uniref:hypothetical protein n=1 Tax=Roseomonas mucosa TaxID=207340 RepID=UPI0022453A5F|nr:hypothetical protein [Roseomonas mucosa]QDD97541.1 Hypothetical protein ADP8_04625a [Roseomonas mucosa]UZO94873.1 Hypothetical protein RMP42_04625 [Roseomonas mucosa]